MSGKEVVSILRNPLVTEERTYKQVSDDVITTLETPPSKMWWISFITALCVLIMGIGVVTYQVRTGIGTVGLNKTIG